MATEGELSGTLKTQYTCKCVSTKHAYFIAILLSFVNVFFNAGFKYLGNESNL